MSRSTWQTRQAARRRRRHPLVRWLNTTTWSYLKPPGSPFEQGLVIHAPAGPGSGDVSCAQREEEFRVELAQAFNRGYSQGYTDGSAAADRQ